MQRRRADCDFSVNAFPLSLTADKSFNRFPETQHVWNRWLHRKKNADKVLLNGLKRLEYRGYDSAGFATNSGGQTHARRAAGRVHELELHLGIEPVSGTVGIAHTRWACLIASGHHP